LKILPLIGKNKCNTGAGVARKNVAISRIKKTVFERKGFMMCAQRDLNPQPLA
jgi:hypothetical protein